MTDFLAANAPLVAILAVLVTVIVAIGCALEGFRLWTARTARVADDGADERIDRLERRVAVLERIVTDRGLIVADEIEALRVMPSPRVKEALS